jgi:flagellin-like protein
MWLDDSDRAATPVVGNILLVAVALVIAVALITLTFAFLEDTGAPTPDAAFEYERTAAGLKMTPQALGTDVIVQLNGEPIASIDGDAAGQPVLVPTAPGDTITVVSEDEDRQVLISREIDSRSEIGDFIAYYTFDSGSNDTLKDRSGNGNDGDITQANVTGTEYPRRTGDALRFDGGADDHVYVSNISAPINVTEFTVAVAYKQRGNTSSSDNVSQLVEHQYQGSTNEWYLETSEAGDGATSSNNYSIDYAVEFDEEVIASDAVERETRHVAVGTYDGEEYALYVDGNQEGTGEHNRTVNMGDMRIAEDFEQDNQHFDGDIYEIRLYYTAFESEEVAVITNAMS